MLYGGLQFLSVIFDMLNKSQALDYNVPGGKLNRGMAVADVYRAIKAGEVSPFIQKSCWMHSCELLTMIEAAISGRTSDLYAPCRDLL